jgi:hypothetical protein
MNPNWQVIIPNHIISWIQKQSPTSFDNYIHSVDGVRKIADLMSEYTIVACGHGFLIFVEGEEIALRCTFFEDKKQIHITHIVS